MGSIAFEHSPFWILPIAFVAFGLAWLLYSSHKETNQFTKKRKLILGAFRFTVLFLLGILLLSPYIKQSEREVKKPAIWIAEDVSASIGAVLDSAAIEAYRSNLTQLKSRLKEDFNLDHRLFSQSVAPAGNKPEVIKATNISSVFNSAYNEMGADNLSAIILLSDGIHNDGQDPVWELEKLKVPVYTIALGDSTRRKDLRVSNVFYNKIAYLNDRFTIQVDVSAYNCAGQSSELRLLDARGNVAERIPVLIDQLDYFKTFPITIDAKPAGVQRFRVELSRLDGESNTLNNSRAFYVEILDARQRVLILAHSPHPDIAAIRQVLEMNQNYQVSVSLASEFKANIKDCDLVVFHQLPSTRFNNTQWLKEVQDRNIPRLFVIGILTDLKTINQWQTALTIKPGSSGSNEVQASIEPLFPLFTISDELKDAIKEFNPMTAPFGEFKSAANANVLLYQRIGKIDTEYPLWVFQNASNGKTAVIAAEGIWKWRLFDFLQRENTKMIEELLQKTVTYLSTKEDKRRFRAYPSKNVYDENEPVFLNGELYNQSYQLINEPDARVTLIDEANKEYNFTFSKRGNAYFLEPGLFPPGAYNFKANVSFGGENLSSEGKFTIEPVEKELNDLTANFGLLERLSNAFGGTLVAPEAMLSLEESIRSNNRIRPVIYESFKTDKGINLKWIFFLLAILLFAEWFLRKYFGSY